MERRPRRSRCLWTQPRSWGRRSWEPAQGDHRHQHQLHHDHRLPGQVLRQGVLRGEDGGGKRSLSSPLLPLLYMQPTPGLDKVHKLVFAFTVPVSALLVFGAFIKHIAVCVTDLTTRSSVGFATKGKGEGTLDHLTFPRTHAHRFFIKTMQRYFDEPSPAQSPDSLTRRT